MTNERWEKDHTSARRSDMKLLVDCIPLSAGGGVQVAVSFLTNLRRQSDVVWHAVLPDALAPQLPAEIAADTRLTFLPKGRGLRRLLLVTKLRRIEETFGPDVVFTVFGPAYFRARAPHVVGFALPNLIYKRSGPIPPATFSIRLADWVRCILLRRADHIVVETETVRQRLAPRLGIELKRISVIGNSINPMLERHIEDISDAGTATQPGSSFTIFAPSAYYPHKNLEVIPRVAAAMHRQDPNLDFEFRLTLATDSAEWRRLTADAHSMGIGARIVTLGVLDAPSLARAYQDSSAVFLPTLREASTAVYPESFFFRRPLVTSDLDFARELCGEAALFVPPFEPERIAQCLMELAQSADLRSKLVEAGQRQLVRAYPSAAEKFSMQLAVLSQVASGKGPGAGS
jgi:glycosyltransferase involved in cell wall biosynthesis